MSVISWVSAVEGCPLSGVPLYMNCIFTKKGTCTHDKMYTHPRRAIEHLDALRLYSVENGGPMKVEHV